MTSFSNVSTEGEKMPTSASLISFWGDHEHNYSTWFRIIWPMFSLSSYSNPRITGSPRKGSLNYRLGEWAENLGLEIVYVTVLSGWKSRNREKRSSERKARRVVGKVKFNSHDLLWQIWWRRLKQHSLPQFQACEISRDPVNFICKQSAMPRQDENNCTLTKG